MDKKKNKNLKNKQNIVRSVTAEGIMSYLSAWFKDKYFPTVEVWDTLGSTNDRAAQLAKMQCRFGETEVEAESVMMPTDCGTFASCQAGDARLCIIVAREQSAGRGTRDRKFFSPIGSGIYMSLLFFADGSCDKYPPITAAAAVAVCDAIDRIDAERGMPPRAGIKWVNDIFLDSRKVCGILAEGAIEGGVLRHFTVGVGLNVSVPEGGFPDELKKIAGAAFSEAPSHEKLIAYITEAIAVALGETAHKDIMRRYRERSITVGRNISVLIDGEEQEVLVTDIGDEGHLVVTLNNGDVREITSASHFM